FRSWSDGGAQTHEMIIPPGGMSAVATYRGLPANQLLIETAVVHNNQFRLGVSSGAGPFYPGGSRSTVSPANWGALADQIQGTGGFLEIADPLPATAGQRFYRAVLLPQVSFGPPDFAAAVEGHGTGITSVSVPLTATGDNRVLLVGVSWTDSRGRS